MAEMFYQSDLKMQSIAEKMQLFNLIKEIHRFRLGGLEAVDFLDEIKFIIIIKKKHDNEIPLVPPLILL